MAVTRFAPSPTGYLHLGHAYSALFAAENAGPGGTMLLRIEDIDRTRCRPAFATAIEEDLRWLGLAWVAPVRRQSAHFDDYRAGLERLDAMGLLYPCFCTRSQLAQASASAPHGADPVYPGTCRHLAPEERARRIASGEAFALRLDTAKALTRTGMLSWTDLDRGTIAADPLSQGDIVLARKDFPASYHLAVTLDDALQGVEIVTRGIDLFEATHIHRLLQALLDLPVPVWRHHALLMGPDGKRLAKRDGATDLRSLRAAGKTPDDIRAMIGGLAT